VRTFKKNFFNQFLIKMFAPNTFRMESVYVDTTIIAIPHTIDFKWL